MEAKEKAKVIVQKMFDNDAMSQWLGISILDVSPGKCTLQMTVRTEMLNGFEIAHGGITYSLADSALAFASNGRGQKAVSIETSIAHLKPVFAGDILTTEVEEKSLQNRIALYEVKVKNQNDELVALFRGTVYRKKEAWEI
ncbi:MAG: hydroxyphenylacetyl-CoA thioesterase PaaI [Bacteroidetes bacterium]|nr:MAG: hydroxyphenylacetyl-CoA thioesterase PaaI [Bacteroidota bacterium]